MAKSSGGNWVTINGVHVLIGANGAITKGPSHLVGKTLNNLASDAPRNAGSNQAKSTRLENYQGAISLMSAQADARRYKKEVEEQKKKKTTSSSTTSTRKLPSEEERHEKTMNWIYSTPEQREVLQREAQKQGLVYTRMGSLVTQKQFDSVNKAKAVQLENRKLEKQFKNASSDVEKQSIVASARQKGINMGSDGKVGATYATPSYPVTIRGVKYDLSIHSARKDAILVSATLSPADQAKFKSVMTKLGYDPTTGKKLN